MATAHRNEMIEKKENEMFEIVIKIIFLKRRLLGR